MVGLLIISPPKLEFRIEDPGLRGLLETSEVAAPLRLVPACLRRPKTPRVVVHKSCKRGNVIALECADVPAENLPLSLVDPDRRVGGQRR